MNEQKPIFYIRRAGSNSYHVFDSTRRNEFGERYCVAAFVTYAEARSIQEQGACHAELPQKGKAAVNEVKMLHKQTVDRMLTIIDEVIDPLVWLHVAELTTAYMDDESSEAENNAATYLRSWIVDQFKNECDHSVDLCYCDIVAAAGGFDEPEARAGIMSNSATNRD